MSDIQANLMRTIADLRRNSRYNAGIQILATRENEFQSTLELQLAGLSIVPEARAYLDEKMDELWAQSTVPPTTAGEVVVGSGPHAAIYCASRVRKGFPKPLVLERGRVGGVFALTKRPTFRLNSTNRPGMIGIPLDGEAEAGLNVLPGAPIQPSMLSNDEYQTNTEIAWVTRLMLALYANVFTGEEVNRINVLGRSVDSKNGFTIQFNRLILATGLGDPPTAADGTVVQTFPQFLQSLDQPFPFRGLKRVAVIGGGDSGKVTVEALLGIGPNAFMSVAGLDFVPRIDWYATNLPTTCEDWRSQERGRYQRIASYLKSAISNVDKGNRLRILPVRAAVDSSFNTALVNSRTYDRVIRCTGFEQRDFGLDGFEFRDFGNGTTLARQYGTRPIFKIGPAANIRLSSAEQTTPIFRKVANEVALFRLANRTAACAYILPDAP